MYNADFTSDDLLVMTEENVLTGLDKMLQERRRRMALSPGAATEDISPVLPSVQQPLDSQDLKLSAASIRSTATIGVVQDVNRVVPTAKEMSAADTSEHRDAGASDEVWTRLEFDKRQATQEEQHYQDTVARQTSVEQEQATHELQGADCTFDEESPENLEARRRLEQERLAGEVSRRRGEEELEELRRRRVELEHQRENERKAQRKLREMGVCVAGFRWIRPCSGYRCAGGSHYVSNEALDAMN